MAFSADVTWAIFSTIVLGENNKSATLLEEEELGILLGIESLLLIVDGETGLSFASLPSPLLD